MFFVLIVYIILYAKFVKKFQIFTYSNNSRISTANLNNSSLSSKRNKKFI